jgi:hypothetical protein
MEKKENTPLLDYKSDYKYTVLTNTEQFTESRMTTTNTTTNNLSEWRTTQGIVLLNPDGTYAQGEGYLK